MSMPGLYKQNKWQWIAIVVLFFFCYFGLQLNHSQEYSHEAYLLRTITIIYKKQNLMADEQEVLKSNVKKLLKPTYSPKHKNHKS